MHKSLWILNQAENIPSIRQFQQWLFDTFNPSSAILAYGDHAQSQWQQWSINRRGIKADTVLLLNTADPIALDTVWPSSLSVQHGYSMDAHEIIAYNDIEPLQNYPFVLQLSGFLFSDGLNISHAIDYWQKGHATIACECQTTVGYTQNVVLAKTDDAPDIEGWVEEAFPVQAMLDPLLFFAADNHSDMQQHLEKIVQSSSKFIAMDSLFVHHYQAIKLL